MDSTEYRNINLYVVARTAYIPVGLKYIYLICSEMQKNTYLHHGEHGEIRSSDSSLYHDMAAKSQVPLTVPTNDGHRAPTAVFSYEEIVFSYMIIQKGARKMSIY